MFEEKQNSESEREVARDFRNGVGYCFGLHAIFAALLAVFYLLQGAENGAIFVPLWFLGVTQSVYIIPVLVVARAKGSSEIAKGLFVGAAITFLLNAACVGYTFWGVFSYLNEAH